DGDSSNGFRDPFNDTPFNSKVFGQLYPGLGLAAGLAHGRVDFGDEYFRLPWYEGSAGGGYGYTEEGYDQYAPGDTDRGIYSSYYDADGNLVTERDWDDSFDDYNTNDRWAQTGLWEGLGNWLSGRTWDGLEEPAIFGDPNSDLAKEGRWGSSKDPLAIQAQQAIATANAEAAAAIQAEADAEQAKLDAEQARWDEQYAQINNLNTEQISLMNDIKSDIQDQYGTFQDEILSQVSAENASMFDSFAEYKEWMGEKFTTQQSGLDEALAIAAATNEGLNSMQIDLMNTIAEDMQNQYGALSAEILSQVSAENAAMFDSLEEYQQWMADDADTAPATIADAVEAGKPFGQEGDDTWSPNGQDIYHGPGHNWNTPDSENTASPGTVTPPPAPTDPFGGGMDDLDWGSGGDDGGDDFDSNEEASDNYDDFGGDWGDWD
ncbi:MAG: hypothetical protein GY727_12320, partial [Gammaproteobacteria bacterium]|nr:hypothetical protein [Gammaproteobacteria bacterium]